VAFANIIIKIAETQIKTDLFTDLIMLFQESGIERAWQQIGNVKLLALPFEVREHDARAARKLPNNLTTRSAGRRQSLGIGNDRQIRELSFTFRQRFPDRNALGANSQTITRTLDVTARVNLAIRRLNGRTHLKIRKRRHLLQARALRRFDQRLDIFAQS
jgi:hypothetical protein